MLKCRNIFYILFLLITIIFLYSCSKSTKYELYTESTEGMFDTVHIIKGYARNEKEFFEIFNKYESEIKKLDMLYNTYENFPGINNLKTVNDNAGIKEIKVDKSIIDLLESSIKWNKEIDSSVNIAFGPVIEEWEKKVVPSENKLNELNKCTNIDDIVIDKYKSTVFLKKKCMKLNVGAVAKGYAVEYVAKKFENEGITSILISAGGNIRVIGQRKEPRKDSEIKDLKSCKINFCVGVAPPIYNNKELDLNNPYIGYKEIVKVSVKDESVVTTGDYQRYFLENGKIYNHVISTKTLKPVENFSSVTVITKDSGIADFLSTTLFLVSKERGNEIINKLMRDKNIKIDAIWMDKNGKVTITDDLKNGDGYVLYKNK